MTSDAKISHASHRHSSSRTVESVLVLQGGGSLGAFACGVFKGLSKEGVHINIASGTSIGAINAAIIAGSKSGVPEKDLENFWLELAESSHNFVPNLLFFDYKGKNGWWALNELSTAGINAAIFGVPKMFVPRWLPGSDVSETFPSHPHSPFPHSWTYIYDHSPLGKTLEKYIDFEKINCFSKARSGTRLIITSANVLTADPIVFDSAESKITTKHLLATTGYPVYGFPWVEIEDGVYGWDGSLLDNTPVRQVIQASPRNDKHIYIVENYPRKIDRLPSNMMEVADRTRDIIFSDKTRSSIRLAKFISRQICLIEDLYDVFESADHSVFPPEMIQRIRDEYSKLVNKYGAEILSVNRIAREETGVPHLLKNSDFSTRQVKALISAGERKASEYVRARREMLGLPRTAS
jgi:NTE family protein